MKDIIKRAVDGGWNPDWLLSEYPFASDKDKIKYIMIEWEDGGYECDIFSHEFLRAYYKYEDGNDNWFVFDKDNFEIQGEDGLMYCEPWEYHAQQLVLAEDRIEYLRRSL